MTWTEAFFVAMMGALVGGGVSLLVQRWRYSVDQWSSRTTEFCAEVTKLADAASEFWLAERKKDDTKLTADVMRVRGGLMRLEALQLPIQTWCLPQDTTLLSTRFGKLADAITGGDFLKPTRKADLNRALEIQGAAADLIGHLHNSRVTASTIRATMARPLHKRLNKWTSDC
ncbi:MAG: hypothetical protein ABL901_19955 [Hyphomicrobiaceae bacterium]|nr:hypothetical protein [Hyphomicrobiaceae bacterium]